jgi:putative ABC transport system ATP-binding protein
LSVLIQLNNIKKSYQLGKESIEVLHDINIEIHAGELLAIMGASGSGKSTLMNIIGLLDQPDSGEYLLNGKTLKNISDDQRSELRNETIGFVFQSFLLLPRLTAIENVALPLQYRHNFSGDIHETCMAMLASVGMKERAKHKPGELSGGQQQRVAIARALIGNPKILLADEPTGALDSKTSDEVIALFKKFNQQQQTTTIIVTHNPDVAKHCDRSIHIKDGKVIEKCT